ncbi:putative toxin, partial [Sphingomonas sp. DT-204]|uniref:putative toxin n=1 Tax=Sphingomonas sp. DT-204 TaxID=3396166 RepID=UPI003F1C39F8
NLAYGAITAGSVAIPATKLAFAARMGEIGQVARVSSTYARAAGTMGTARSLPNQLGRAGETVSAEVTGLPRNTVRIPSASGAKEYRIPDHLEPLDQRYIAETKNVKYQTLTSQILDDVAHVNRSGYPGRVDVIIDKRTTISGPLLREHLNSGSPIKIKTTDLNRR